MKRASLWIVLLVAFVSCESARKEGERFVDQVKVKAEKEVEEKTRQVIDKVFPPFDHDQPDTENNKQRFKDFLKIELTPDIKNIYCFDDAIGIDADYMFAFDCDPATSVKVIEAHNLTVDTINKDNGAGLQNDFEWWDKEKIAQLQKYSWTDGKQYHKYYWYDRKERKAYFFDFDM